MILVFSLLGSDRTGLVDRLSGAVTDHGGNLEEARMAVLGGEFAVMMMVSVERERRDGLERAVRDTAAELDMSVFVRETSIGPHTQARRSFTVKVHGADHEGIVHPIVNWLASRGVSILNLESHVGHAPHTGTQLFSMTLHLEAPSAASIADIHQNLRKIADRLNVDVEVISEVISDQEAYVK